MQKDVRTVGSTVYPGFRDLSGEDALRLELASSVV